MRVTGILAGVVGAVLLLAGSGSAQPTGQPTALKPQANLQRAPRAETAAPPTKAAEPLTAHPLDAGDLNGWLDGFMPYALANGDIAGAVVVVVKDGQVLTERGYGYSDVKTQAPVDPKLTMFRPGSISKLFTWTSVMQLVEQGKLNLDADVNGYLDFKIPAYDGKPVTLRNLMTHSAGFEEAAKDLFAANAQSMLSLERYIKLWTPKRIVPPGQEAAYSNYGAALAGYIVQRVSGEPFNDYVAHHIFQPLDMAHSSFAQPLPTALLPDMSKGYSRASVPARPFEFVAGAPAGALASTGDDMSRFMLAQLQDGHYGSAQILKPETARLMHATAFVPIPHLPGMALGFYHEDRNGHVIIAHAGDTENFHSDLHLYLSDGVGLFVSLNSLGRNGAAAGVRQGLFHDFTDRYFPGPPQNLATAPTAKADAAAMAGTYVSNRRPDSSFLRLFSVLGHTAVKANPDGTIVVSAFKSLGGAVKRWREIGPFYWQEVGGDSYMAARVQDGKVLGFTSDDEPPVLQFEPAPPWVHTGPLLLAVGLLFLLGVLWPISAIARRRYGHSFAVTGQPAWGHRLVRIGAWIAVLAFVSWFALLTGTQQSATGFSDALVPWLRLVQFISLLAILAALAALWNLWLVWRDKARSWFAKLSSAVWTLAFLVLVWYILNLHLITASANF